MRASLVVILAGVFTPSVALANSPGTLLPISVGVTLLAAVVTVILRGRDTSGAGAGRAVRWLVTFGAAWLLMWLVVAPIIYIVFE